VDATFRASLVSYISLYFADKELACKDCGVDGVTDELKQALDDYRKAVGVPVIIDDAYRCPLHNKEVGGVSGSQHLFGKAADIHAVGKTLQQMYDAAKTVPAFFNGGIGVYDGNFIHVDVRGVTARWARVNGKYIGIEESKLVTP
jgi:uncharacterized protein YcbK (DUF882 family)